MLPPTLHHEGAIGAETGPSRRCCATGEILPRWSLLRLALQDGLLYPDLDEKLPGRGVWVTPTPSLLQQATKKGGFAKSLKAPVQLMPELEILLPTLLLARVQAQLGLMRRSGAVLAGFDQVSAALRQGQIKLRLEALDGSLDGRRKLDNAAAKSCPVLSVLTADEQGAALGRSGTVHLGVKAHGLFDKFLSSLTRLHSWRQDKAFSLPRELLQESAERKYNERTETAN